MLLLVDYAEAKVDFVGLLKARLHGHDLREGFFCVFEGAVAVIEYADAVPQLRLLKHMSTRR